MADRSQDNLEIREPEYEYADEIPDRTGNGYYGTGSTTPPKDYAGMVALVLVLFIFLSGLLTALGLFDIHPFGETDETEPDVPVVFSAVAGTYPPGLEAVKSTGETESLTVPTCPVEIPEPDLELTPSPQGLDNISVEGALSWQQVYDKLIPSVVSIVAQNGPAASTGTGVIMDENGYVITNAHVVQDAAFIQVLLTDGRTLEGICVGFDAVSDLAVLYIDAPDLTAAEFGDSDALRVGDQVVAIGDPLGVELRGTMTDGIISAINRDLKLGGKNMTLLQTTAALNAGNSGGPLVNCYGQVIGINAMKIGDYASSGGVEGLGFAIPSTLAASVVEQLMTQGYVSGRPTLGIEGSMVSNFYQYYYHLPAGVLIAGVHPRSPAQMAGLQSGDILLSLDGIRLNTVQDLQDVMYQVEIGQEVIGIYYRAGREYEVSLIIGEDTQS